MPKDGVKNYLVSPDDFQANNIDQALNHIRNSILRKKEDVNSSMPIMNSSNFQKSKKNNSD